MEVALLPQHMHSFINTAITNIPRNAALSTDIAVPTADVSASNNECLSVLLVS